MPKFSVIIPTYNRAALLREALESVFPQTFTDYEVIVVDDGSTDDTANFLSTLGGRVRILRQQNCGPGVAAGSLRRADLFLRDTRHASLRH
jgi:glycosyltransferase involved in cell wall biosynthesis